MVEPTRTRKRGLRRAVVAAAAALGLIFAIAGGALADNVNNDVTVGGSDTIVAGGTTQVGYKVVATSGADGQAGCNAADATPMTLTIAVPAGVTATSSDPTWNAAAKSLRFSSCGDFKYVTYGASGAGNYALNVGIADGGAGSYNNNANFTLHVNPAPPTNTAPTVSVTGVSDGASYEIGSVPTAGCSVVDAEDGNSSFAATLGPLTGPLAVYGVGSQTASCAYTDAGGLSDSASATYDVVDTTAPGIAFAGRTPPANAFGWSNGSVTLEWSCSDAGSGVVSATTSETLTAEGANQSATGTCTDNAGNTATDTQTGIDIDLTDPLVALVGGPADGGSYYFGFVPSAPSCTASDGLSGLDGACSVGGYSAAVGSHTVTATATDKAGNGASDSHSYAVSAWTLRGFYQPVDNGGVLNTVKGGATVPLKFEIFAGQTELTDTAYVDGIAAKTIACDTSAALDDVEVTATGGTALRYDATAGQYVYNWQTPKTAGKCVAVTVTTKDGGTLTASFKLK